MRLTPFEKCSKGLIFPVKNEILSVFFSSKIFFLSQDKIHSFVSFGFSFFLFVFAKSHPFHRAPDYGRDWKVLERSDWLKSFENEVVTFTFGVKQSNLNRVRSIVEKVSDPRSPEYGKFLTG